MILTYHPDIYIQETSAFSRSLFPQGCHSTKSSTSEKKLYIFRIRFDQVCPEIKDTIANRFTTSIYGYDL